MAFGSYEVGVIQRTPVPNLDNAEGARLGELALACVELKRDLDRANEISHVFHLPALLQAPHPPAPSPTRGEGEMVTLAERAAAWSARVAAAGAQLAAHQRQIDDIAFALYGIHGDDRRAIEASSLQNAEASSDDADDEDGADDAELPTAYRLLPALVSYLAGCVFGRWDIRYATGARPAPALPDPFAPLPVCPPGMLQNAHGLPATCDHDIAPIGDDGHETRDRRHETAEGRAIVGRPSSIVTETSPEFQESRAAYPLRISWPGILVDDAGHPEDIAGRAREALEVIWGQRAEAIEQEACEILGVRSLREYFRKPALFFADHLARYSKSRRQAPIYWPLSTPSGSYTLWLYYQRLTDQTLYTCVNDFVEPKLAHARGEAARLRQKAARTRADERELERLADLERELADFRAELLRVAAFWKPNLNDGAQISAAPLWKLFAHRPWQKRLKETWEKLEAGEYDWAHLAYSIWPERVRARCRADKSLAIAHDLEALYVEPAAKRKK